MVVSKEIIEACKRNERSAQKFIYENFFSRMHAICMRYIREEEETLEVLNDGFISLFMNISQYKGEGNFEGWARKIIVNKAIDHIRSNKKYKETLKYVEEFLDEPVSIDAEAGLYDIKELYKLIHSLPEVYQIVFNLYAVDGFSHKEIAEKIGISEGTSRWYLSESRKMLKEKLTLINEKI
jgi:RNA polymerase sigma factor (sigma-70 family)